MKRLVLLVMLVSLPVHARARAKPCFSHPMAPSVLRFRAELPGSGGVIVASGEERPDWRFQHGNQVVRADVVQIAPGLWIYHPPLTVGPHLILEAADHTPVLVTKRALEAKPVLAAPTLVTVARSAGDAHANFPVRAATATLDANAPTAAVALVIYAIQGEQRTPRSWVQVEHNTVRFDVWHTPYRCDLTIPQSIEPVLGEHVAVAWLDDGGRLSELSNAVTVVAAKP